MSHYLLKKHVINYLWWGEIDFNFNLYRNHFNTIITTICVQVHSMFHYILNEIGQIYNGESEQPFINGD
jgi:hypothetical protein